MTAYQDGVEDEVSQSELDALVLGHDDDLVVLPAVSPPSASGSPSRARRHADLLLGLQSAGLLAVGNPLAGKPFPSVFFNYKTTDKQSLSQNKIVVQHCIPGDVEVVLLEAAALARRGLLTFSSSSSRPSLPPSSTSAIPTAA